MLVWLHYIAITNNPVSASKFSQLECDPLLDCSESIQCVKQLVLLFPWRQALKQVMSKQQVLRGFEKAVFGKFFGHMFWVSSKILFCLQWITEQWEEWSLLFSKVRLSICMICIQEVGLDFAMFYLITVYLSDWFQGQVNVGNVVDVDDLHHAGSTLINWVHFSVK